MNISRRLINIPVIRQDFVCTNKKAPGFEEYYSNQKRKMFKAIQEKLNESNAFENRQFCCENK